MEKLTPLQEVLVATAEQPTQRKDVARNRRRLLAAAREVFAAHGLAATLDDIAHHAGVGAGTAYRHFGSRKDIIAAIFSDAAQSFVADAEDSLRIADPWQGLVAFVETFCRRQADDRGLHQVFVGHHEGLLSENDWAALVQAISAVINRAKAAGAVRSDIELSDLVTFLAMMGPAYDVSIAASVPIWRRHVDIFLRALRADTGSEAIAAPEALSTEAISTVVTGRN